MPMPKKLKQPTELYDIAYHARLDAEERAPAEALVGYLRTTFKPTSVGDYGCSVGTYVKPWIAHTDAYGYESSPSAVAHRIHPDVQRWDLKAPLPRAHDMGVCLEVLEHIPAEDAPTIIKNITRATRQWLIFSAAKPGQGGVGHINCQDKPYWIGLFEKQSWVVDFIETCAMLQTISKGPHMGWFLQNGMVLRPLRGSVP